MAFDLIENQILLLIMHSFLTSYFLVKESKLYRMRIRRPIAISMVHKMG